MFTLFDFIPVPVLILVLGLGVVWALVLVGIWVVRRHAVRWAGGEGGRPALAAAGLIWLMRVYTRFWHRLDATGTDRIPELGLRNDEAGRPIGGGRPVVLISNHTAGIDPLLIQSALPFEVRWMMAADMRARVLEPLWRYGRIIFVDRAKRDSTSLREAMRHLQAGGCLGVFVEGYIAKPPRHLLPFKEGTGLLIRRTDALVLPVVIEGTPEADTAWGSLLQRSRSKVRFLEPVDYSVGGLSELDGPGITADLRRRFKRATGWPDTALMARLDEHGKLVREDAGSTGPGDSATLGA